VVAVSGDSTAADNMEADYDGTGYAGGTIHKQADLVAIHGTALTETATQLAGRFTDFFDQAAAGYTVATALSSFKATGFSTLTQSQVTGGAYALDTDANGRVRIVDGTGAGEIDTDSRRVQSDLVYIHGTALTETAGQLAGRFVDFFGQASVTFSVATAPADYKATGFNVVTPDTAGVAAGLHGVTDGLIGGLVVPDAAGTAAGLHGVTDGLIGGLVVPDAAGTPVTLANGAHGGAAASMNLASGLTANITGSLSGAVGSVTGLVPGNLDTTISSRAAAATALSTAQWTNVRAGYLDELAAGNLPTDIADIPTVAEFNARTLPSADYFVVTDYTAPDNAGIAAILLDTGTTLPTTLTLIMGAGFATGDESLEAIRTHGDVAWLTGAGGDATVANQNTLLARLTLARAALLDNLTRLDALISTRATPAQVTTNVTVP